MSWTKAGELNMARQGHAAIFSGDVLVVMGGTTRRDSDFLSTEACKLNNGIVACTKQAPAMQNYDYYPELYLVNDSFCQN